MVDARETNIILELTILGIPPFYGVRGVATIAYSSIYAVYYDPFRGRACENVINILCRRSVAHQSSYHDTVSLGHIYRLTLHVRSSFTNLAFSAPIPPQQLC